MATTASVGLALDFRSAPRQSRDTPEARPGPAGKRAAPAHPAADGDQVWPEDTLQPSELTARLPPLHAAVPDRNFRPLPPPLCLAQGSHAK
ncbi:unnamed protein product, partial [Rangifer tarandus platyrhynchus]